MQRSKKFRVGDKVRVKSCNKDAGGEYASKEGEVFHDSTGGPYPYLVGFGGMRKRPFCAAELELIERPGGVNGQV